MSRNSDKPAQIRRIFDDAWHDEAALMYRSAFVLRSGQLDYIPMYAGELRQITMNCDMKTVLLLSETERRTLALLTQTSFPLASLTKGLGMTSGYLDP